MYFWVKINIGDQMKILFLFPGFPDKKTGQFLFLEPFIDYLVTSNISATIVAPVSISRDLISLRWNKIPIKRLQKINSIEIIRPIYFSLSNFRLFGFNISILFKNLAIIRALKFKDFDLVYSHFWGQLLSSCLVSKKSRVVISSGESLIAFQRDLPRWLLTRCLNRVNGIIGLSTQNLEISTSYDLPNLMFKALIPNAVDISKFKPMCIGKELINIPDDSFLIGFIGSDEPRKGLVRLIASISRLKCNVNIYLLIIGEVKNKDLLSEFIIETGIVSHNEVPLYLNVCDIYCHVSSAEGSSNAILEALACGKPVIASNKRFNDDIINDTNSLRIDESNIDQISLSILKLMNDNELRTRLSYNALESSRNYSLIDRIENIMKFISNFNL